MSSKLSIETVLANLEQRAIFHREKEAWHAQQEAHHREQRTVHAAELEKVLQGLEAFRTVAATVVDLAQPIPAEPVPAAAAAEELPPPGRLMASRLMQLVIESPDLGEPFGPATVAAETNRRFADRLRKSVGPRAASDVLRRMLATARSNWSARVRPSMRRCIGGRNPAVGEVPPFGTSLAQPSPAPWRTNGAQ